MNQPIGGRFRLMPFFYWGAELKSVPEQLDRTKGFNMHLPIEHNPIQEKILQVYEDLFLHDGYGELSIEMRFLKKGQKEIIIHSGKDYRYVVDYSKNRSGKKGAALVAV